MKRRDLGTLSLATAAGCFLALAIAGAATNHINNRRLDRYEDGSNQARRAQLIASNTPYLTFNGDVWVIHATTGSHFVTLTSTTPTSRVHTPEERPQS